VGKTFTEAGIIIWFLTTHYKGKVICTAPTQHQLYQVLWSELAKMNENSLVKSLFEWTASRFTYKESHADWFAVARSSSKAENMQGFHAEHMLIIVDEASGVEEEIMEAIEGATTDAGNIIMMFGNPTKLSGSFYDSFHDKKEYFTNITLSCLDSRIVNKKYAPTIESKYGITSNMYRVRVLGEFPKQEDESIINVNDIEKAMLRKNKINNYSEVEFGVDVARFGDDETAIYKRINNVITEEWISKENTTMQIVGKIVNLIKEYNCKIIINIDDTGVGGGVTDRLKELRDEKTITSNVIINGVNNNNVAINKKYYKNIITEMWYYLKDNIKKYQIPNDKILKKELSTRNYEIISDGRLMVESKEKFKKRNKSSPDRADGLLLSLFSNVRTFDIKTSRSKEERKTIKDENVVKEESLKDKIKRYKKRRK